MERIKLASATHRDQKIILIQFEKNDAIVTTLRANFKTFAWSKTFSSWYIVRSSDFLNQFFKCFRGKFFIDYGAVEKVQLINTLNAKSLSSVIHNERAKSKPILAPLNETQTKAIEQFVGYLKSIRYAENTIGTYSDAVKIFFRFFSDRTIDSLEASDITFFNNNYILKYGYSASYQNQVVNAIKLFFRVVQNTKMEIESIERPRREHRLPNVLSKEEVKLILQSLENKKHVAMLSLIYACGLRRSELLSLSLKDIHSDRNLLIINQSKGKKDRVVPISDKLILLLREYYLQYKPKKWLFEGQHPFSQYSERSLELVLKKSVTIANIKKPVTLHWLRHSYATHLMESGTDLRFIQELLGHKSSKTTEIYTHVSTKSIQQIKSPFDDL
jgi:integrase/recombinase XerD